MALPRPGGHHEHYPRSSGHPLAKGLLVKLTRAQLLDSLTNQVKDSKVLSDQAKDDLTMRLILSRDEILQGIYDTDAIGRAEAKIKGRFFKDGKPCVIIAGQA
jgi:hypothetical protein